MDDYNNLDAWLEAVRRQLGTDLALSTDDQRALLDLTRVAAHRSQRIARGGWPRRVGGTGGRGGLRPRPAIRPRPRISQMGAIGL